MTYIVKVYRGIKHTPKYETEYLVSIRGDAYQAGNVTTHITTADVEDAFRFHTLEAAEMAAVFVGGEVVEEEETQP
jgi:hypothetical protein